MVSLFREKYSASIFWLVMLSIALHVHFFIDPPEVVVHLRDGLVSDVLVYLKTLPEVVLMVLYHILVLVQALRLNYVLNELRMFQRQAFTTAMAYVLLTALLPEWNHITPALICNSLIIWLLHKMTQLYNSNNAKTIIFNIGLIAGSTVIFYHPTFSVVLLCFMALAILRPFRLNEWFILLLGVLTPFYFLLSALYLEDKFADVMDYLPQWKLHVKKPTNVLAMSITAGLLLLLWLSGMYIWNINSNRMIIQVRKNWAVLLLAVLVLVPVGFLTYASGWEAGLLAIVPLSAFASNVFLYPRKALLPALFFWALVAVYIYNNWAFIKK
ncbi:hypothetical protein [Deminuibacter soli]|uniref:Beta-carotene 15,15'-monooxygenase n=1 Tax=Deminuibacter soli TaxID=2291815 RepID=A0A3E1NNC7_9BACT|nr:hypothetical protein [Deminuibacter soli]RFM29445.1 hypothetical protein DXN05_00200 [Deminuibacter soli]